MEKDTPERKKLGPKEGQVKKDPMPIKKRWNERYRQVPRQGVRRRLDLKRRKGEGRDSEMKKKKTPPHISGREGRERKKPEHKGKA